MLVEARKATTSMTDKEKIDIVEKYNTGKYNCAQLAKEYGKERSSINRLLKRRGIKIDNNRNRKYTLDETFFDEINTEEKAYFLGLLYADGCNDYARTRAIISLQESDEELLQKLNKIINSNRPLVSRNRQNEKDGLKRKNQKALYMSSRRISESLIKLGCVPAKSLILKFPTKEQVPEHLIRHFVRGYFDGDGSIYERKDKSDLCSSIISTNDFCINIKNIIKKQLSINSRIRDGRNKNGITKELRISGRNQSKIFLHWIYKDSKIYLQRKYDKYIELTKSTNCP